MLQILACIAVIAPAHQGKLLVQEHGEFSPQFPLRLMGKDFKLILDQADALHLPMPATAASYAVNRKCAERSEELDFSSLMEEVRVIIATSGPGTDAAPPGTRSAALQERSFAPIAVMIFVYCSVPLTSTESQLTQVAASCHHRARHCRACTRG